MNATSSKFKQSRIHQGISQTLHNRFSSSLLARTAWLLALAAGTATTVQAQDAQLEEIQITGTRITRSTMETPTPVTTIAADELASMAPGNLIESLTQMPQFYGNLTPEGVNGGQNAGGSNVNLRGAGSNRTLTLLNGRRMVPSNRFGTVDVNLFPEDLLRSVESVTGGASASYGTDAVAGVVNFILDTDYEGFKTHTQTGMTEYGDGRTWEVGAAFGKDLGNGLHLLGSLAAFDQSKISSFGSLLDREEFLIRSARITNPNAAGPTDIIRPYASPTTFTPTGILIDNTRPTINRQVFDANGNLSPLNFTGVGALTTGCLCYSGNDPSSWGIDRDMELGNAFRRYNSFLYLDYDLSESTNLFLQGIYAENSASDQRESITLQSIWQGRVYPDNAFLSNQARDLIVASGAPFVGYGLAAVNTPDTVLGESRQDTDNKMYSVTTGFEHEFSFGWNLNGYYQYGKNVQDFVTDNGVRVDRLQFAFDAVRDPASGQIVCRVNLPQFTGPLSAGGNGNAFRDCAPINTFGGIQNISQAGADYIMDRDGKIARQWTDQHMAELVTSGEVFDGFGSGPVDAAFGVSYRKEALDQRTLNPADEYPAQVNNTLLSNQGLLPAGIRGVVPQGSTVLPGYSGIPGLRFVPSGYLGDANSSSVLFSSLREIAGGYNVKEAFAEFNWPLLSDMALVDMLEINTAARWADYSGSGDIWAWKLSANWTVNDEIRLRATRSRDVRAASLRERYDQTRGGANVQNPWDNRNAVQAASLSGGNPTVSPEEADTITAGIVYQPAWLDGFSASVDWYSIDIAGALAQLGAQNVVDNCFRGDISLCQYVISSNGPVTNPSGGFRTIERVEAIFINLDTQKIEGADMELQYRTDVDFMSDREESLSMRFLTSWMGENSIQSKGGLLDDRAGQIGGFGFPEWKVTTNVTYNIENYSMFVQGRWSGDGILDRTRLESQTSVPLSARPAGSLLAACGTNICTIDDNSIPSSFYMDARLNGTFGERDNLQVFLNIQNLLDRSPVLTPGIGVGRTGVGTGVNTGLYDILGRRYTIGVNYEF